MDAVASVVNVVGVVTRVLPKLKVSRPPLFTVLAGNRFQVLNVWEAGSWKAASGAEGRF